MQLSKSTLNILKNFTNINTNIIFKVGNHISTITAKTHHILAEAKLEDSFPIDFGIYDLSEFLGVLSLMENPDLTFSDKYVDIRNGSSCIRFHAASQNILTQVPQVKRLPSHDIEFCLSSQMLANIQKVASVLRVPDISFVGDGSNVSIMVKNKENPTSNMFESAIGETDKVFSVNLKVEYLRFLPLDYAVTLHAKKVMRFQSAYQDLTYYVAVEFDSTFDF